METTQVIEREKVFIKFLTGKDADLLSIIKEQLETGADKLFLFGTIWKWLDLKNLYEKMINGE